MLNKIVAACLLSLAALPAIAAGNFRSEYRLNMSEAEFRKANELYFGQGLRLVDITVTESKDGPRIGAIWQWFSGMPAGSPERAKAQLALVFLKLDQANLALTGQRLGQEGSGAEVIDAYVVGGKTWFAVSFAPPKEPTMQTVGAFLGTDEMAGMREDARKNNNDVVRIDAYGDGKEMKAFPAFINRGPAEIEASAYENTLAVSAANAGMYIRDMQPLSISVFQLQGDTRYLASWDNSGLPREFIMTDAGEKIRAAVEAGGIVMDLDSDTASDGSVLYYAVLQKTH